MVHTFVYAAGRVSFIFVFSELSSMTGITSVAPKEVEFRICLFHKKNRLFCRTRIMLNISNCSYSEGIPGKILGDTPLLPHHT